MFNPEHDPSLAVKHVDSAPENEFSDIDKSPENVLPEEELQKKIAEFQQEMQKTIDGHKKLFASFAGDNSLQFMLSDGFYFLPEKGEVHIAASWFMEQGYTQEQIIWACFHELSHFRDMVQEPDAYLENFDYIRERAKETGTVLEQKWREKYEEEDPEFIERITKQKPLDPKKPEKGTMNAIEQSAYGMHHRFFNVMDDIYVNNTVRQRAGRYARGEEGDVTTVTPLYRDKLFVGDSYLPQSNAETKHEMTTPRHVQLINKLLRDEMLRDEPALVSEEIEDVLKKKRRFRGMKYDFNSLIDARLKPREDIDHRPGTRYELIKKTLEPIFIELLMKDIEESEYNKPEPQESGGSGDGEDGEKGDGSEDGQSSAGSPGEIKPEDLDPFKDSFPDDQANPDQFTEDDVKDFIEKAKEAKDERESAESMDPEERAEMERRERLKEWDEKHDISPEERENYERILKKVTPYLDDLLELWKAIAHGKSRGKAFREVGHFQSGKLDIDQVIKEYPDIEDASFKGTLDELSLSTRLEEREGKVVRPELIRFKLLCDQSGSMYEDRREILRETLVLLTQSLMEFNAYLDRTRRQSKSSLRVETEVWAFGSDFRQLKEAHSNREEELASIIKAVGQTNRDLGSTNDAALIHMLNEKRTQKDRTRAQSGKQMDITFEITDGVPNSQSKTRDAVNRSTNDGVIMNAFQIGESDEYYQSIFSDVWNADVKEDRGILIGEEIQRLPIAVSKLLKKYLHNVRT